jgi:transposase
MEPKRPFSDLDWAATPQPVKQYIEYLEQTIATLVGRIEQLEKRIEQLEARTKQNSQNSSKPPSSDSPFNKPKKQSKKGKRKRGAQKGHKGHQQQMLAPTETKIILPTICDCGRHEFDPNTLRPYYTHQHIELPEIQMDVSHFILHKGKCKHCGKTVRAVVPTQYQSGYGPRLSATIAELSGSHGASRQTVQDFCQSILGIPISVGGIQCILDRTSEALKPVYDEIARQARQADVNHVDETSWFQSGALNWLWTLANHTVAFFMVHPHRSKQAFDQLVDGWKGILVSDNYGVYVNWVNSRQTCLAHYIRKAKALIERDDKSIIGFGKSVLKHLQQLCHWAKAPPSEKQWTKFYSEFLLNLFLFESADDDAGRLARLLLKEMNSLWVFLEENGVEPTNNRAERALRFGVLWRKRSNGTQSDKGNRWVERILSVKQTCRIKKLPMFPILVDAIGSYFKEQQPNLGWLTT